MKKFLPLLCLLALYPISAQALDAAVYTLQVKAAAGDGHALETLTGLANHGDPDAQNALGVAYDDMHVRNPGDTNVQQELAEATKWYRMAADQGSVTAQENLASRYARGYGVPQDFAEAYFWYGVAAKLGDKNAGALAAIFIDGAAANPLTPEQKEAADKRVAEWKPAATAAKP
jgi:TPR repeat protein